MAVTFGHLRRGGLGLAGLALLGTAFIAPLDRAEPATAATPAVTAPGGVSSGLALWLDASNPNGDGSTPAEGALITEWVDLSGDDRDVSVPSGKTAATYSSSRAEFDGRPALQFARTSDTGGSVYSVPNLDIRPTTTPDITVLAVYRPTSLSGNHGVWGSDNGNWDRFFLSRHPSFGSGGDDGVVGLGPKGSVAESGEVVSDSGTTTDPKLMAVAYSGNVVNGVNTGDLAASFVYFNCRIETTFTDTTHATDAQSTFAIGWDGDNSVFDGYIAEVIVYKRVLSLAELEDVNGYLATKYGLSGGCAEFACDLTGARTFSQGGWSNKSVARLMTEAWFDANIGTDLVIGDGSDSGSVTLTTAGNVRRFLPQSGTPAVLRSNLSDPTTKSLKNTLAGQATALTLNLALNPGMANARLSNGYDGTVVELLDEINDALNGTGSPSKGYLSALNGHADYVNLSFPQGVDQLRLTCNTDG